MSDDEILIAIGEIMGSVCKVAKLQPDYLNDLNAVHGVEETVIIGQTHGPFSLERIYSNVLSSLCITIQPFRDRSWHATARQRCEALLRVTGRWKENKE